MEETQNLVKTSMEEIRGVLSAESVVGEPIVVGGNTIIPIVSVGFGFCAGGGTGEGGKSDKETGERRGHRRRWRRQARCRDHSQRGRGQG